MGYAEKEKQIYTFEEYIEMEANSELRYEFYQGEVFAMSGTTDRHNEIVLNTAFVLRGKLSKKPCRTYTESVKLEIDKKSFYTYPDVFVTCEPRDLEDSRVKRYPGLIVEVLSDSTEAYDRGFKWLKYKNIPSLKYYLLISQKEMSLEVFTRSEDDKRLWLHRSYNQPEEEITLSEYDLQFTLAQIYEGLTWEENDKEV